MKKKQANIKRQKEAHQQMFRTCPTNELPIRQYCGFCARTTPQFRSRCSWCNNINPQQPATDE